jgi:fatty-acyl-CoA synthase
MHTLMAGYQWFGIQQDAVYLAVLPILPRHRHAGQHERPLFSPAPPWCCCRAGTATPPRSCIAALRRHLVDAIPTMVVDFLMNPRLGEYDLSRISA